MFYVPSIALLMRVSHIGSIGDGIGHLQILRSQHE